MKCPSCFQDNLESQKFCGECGARLGPSGAAAHSPSLASYTPSHLAQKILTSRSALEGERKLVTVLFCDISNSTQLAALVGADAMHVLLNRFFDLALAEVHRYEGTINQFLGDGFMALFGAPLAHEDHARRALLAALGIQQRLRDTAVEDATLREVRVRMGVNTGTVVVGKIGDNLRMDYTGVGDTTNLAARLQQFAQPGLIYVSESVSAAGHPYFDFRSLGKHSLKGINEPVAVYDLVRSRSREESESRAMSLGIGSPLVGRHPELALLEEELSRLLRGKGGILLLSGEPGAGKSRLVAETKRRVNSGNLLWLEGRAVSFGHSLSYLPFIEILKNCFDIEDDEAEDESWRKLEQGLNVLFSERTPEVVPYLATVLALRVPPGYEDRVKYLDGQGLRRQVFLCMRQLFERLALRQPVVLLLEDWHWADQSSASLAEHLLSLTDATGLLVWCVTRPDREGPTARIRHFASANPGYRFQEVALSPLSEEQSIALVGNLVGTLDLPVALQEQILRKTEGNPFFIEEVIRSLVTDGVLVRGSRERSWQLAKSVAQVNLPDTIQGLILARIDRLDEEVKQALKLASVIGRSFFHRLLKAISEAQSNLDSSIAELKHAELIRQRQQLPEIEYIFKHALVQETAYSSILAERRRAIHRRVAQAIETLFEDRLDEFTSLLAYHYTRAEDWDKAQEYLFKAGDQAGRMAADAEALEHFQQAETAYLKAFGDKLTPIQRASLARKIGAALYGTGHYEQAHEQFRRALLQLGFRYPTSRWGVRLALLRHLAAHLFRRLCLHAGMLHKREMSLGLAKEISTVCHLMGWVDYHTDEERMTLDGVLELHAGERSHYAFAEARGLSDMVFVFMTFNAHDLARRYHTEAGAIAKRLKDPSLLGFSLFALGFLDFQQARWDESASVMHQAVAAYREAGDIHGWGGPTVMLALLYGCFQGELSLAEALASELVRMGQDAADPQLTVWGYLSLGALGLSRGPLDETAINLRKVQDLAAKIPAFRNLLMADAFLAKCHLLQGKLNDSLAALKEAMRLLRDRNLSGPLGTADTLNGMVETYLALADRLDGSLRRTALRDASRACDKALRFARRAPGWMPEALRLQGTLNWLSGNQAVAQERWRESIAVANKFALPIECARTLLEIGHRTSDTGLVEQASEIFRQTGAKVFLAFALHSLVQLHSRSSTDAVSAIQSYAKAISALEEVKAHYRLGVAYRQRAHLHKQLGQLDKSRSDLTNARDCFETVGATLEQAEVERESNAFSV